MEGRQHRHRTNRDRFLRQSITITNYSLKLAFFAKSRKRGEGRRDKLNWTTGLTNDKVSELFFTSNFFLFNFVFYPYLTEEKDTNHFSLDEKRNIHETSANIGIKKYYQINRKAISSCCFGLKSRYKTASPFFNPL